jgi:hypothetical protein
VKKAFQLMCLVPVLWLAGCAYNPRVAVYGASGKQYIAPDLCGAIVQCKNASEKDCYYNASVVTSLDGKSTTVDSCKAAK